ncbi:uncharacterized protein EI97DRAFT_174116 [Westerdykella ornata]|uniref:Secreted protein n=1 Tax=Westerdykella ornata TaxID=318751 RepID=A0A6A6JT08_WESOR|nr:uncharacterized protein EI97DRAFT_174116 [Westerdykella ornata]KAF2279374.1 hypothetical protein EI97DRAFT_174116 [Westerdykella ornata]
MFPYRHVSLSVAVSILGVVYPAAAGPSPSPTTSTSPLPPLSTCPISVAFSWIWFVSCARRHEGLAISHDESPAPLSPSGLPGIHPFRPAPPTPFTVPLLGKPVRDGLRPFFTWNTQSSQASIEKGNIDVTGRSGSSPIPIYLLWCGWTLPGAVPALRPAAIHPFTTRFSLGLGASHASA